MHSIPITESVAMEDNAGCLAKSKTPVPIMVVVVESMMELRYDCNLLIPSLNRLSKPSVTKMQKSSHKPKIKVVTSTFTKLNFMPNKPHKPKLQNQLSTMGKKVRSANSMRP